MLSGTTLNRMIFWELVRVFLLALSGLTGLFLLVGLIQQASQLGLSPLQVLALIPLSIPSSLPYTVPATTLFASCVVYGRLAHDNEVVAIKGAGVHLFQILKPALALGVITTVMTAGLYHTTIPVTQQMLQQEILKDPEEMLYSALRRERCIRHPTFPYVLYVKDVQGRRLVDVVLKRRVKVEDKRTETEVWNGYDVVARAREARLRVDIEQGVLYLDPDRLVFYDKNSHGTTASNGPFPMKLPDNMTAGDTRNRPMSLTWDELAPRAATLRLERDGIETDQAKMLKTARDLPDGEERKRTMAQNPHFKARIEGVTRNLRNVEAEFWMRPALACGCLVFALIGCPVGIWATRADYLSAFVICWLPTILIYYPLLLAGANMGKDGRLPLGLGCWLANIVLGGLGIALTWRLLRR